MRVAIVGGGSIGLLFGYFLAKTGGNLTVYARRKEQAQDLERHGLKLASGERQEKVSIQAQVFDEVDRIDADLAVIAVKQYDLSGLMENIKSKVSERTKLLFVQNGMSHVDLMASLPHKDIYIGIVEHGALKLSDHQVDHTGKGIVKLAAYKGSLDSEAVLWDKLGDVGFPIECREDWYEMMAEKLLVNAVINPLTALYRVQNGELASRGAFFRNMKRLFDEAFHILELTDAASQWGNVMKVVTKTAKNRSSMLRDIEMGRETEIEAISGYLLKQASLKNEKLPCTQFVYDSVVGLSNERRKD